ncbi:MAG TPA: protein-disulfide reductase DsbD N-terminal domain-containing protein [Acidobacteriaceae bacterium]
MIRRSFLSIAAIAIFTAAYAPAQIGNMDPPAKPKAYVLYAAEPQTISAGKQATLELRFQVVQGYHVNSHTPKSQLLIPTALTLQPTGGVKSGALEYPAGKPYSFSFDPSNKLDVYAGAFTIRLPVVAAAGEHTMDGSLRYQACDNASCYPPRSVPVKIMFTAK